MKHSYSAFLSVCLAAALAVPANAADPDILHFQKQQPYLGFSDLSNDHWAADSIRTCVEYGLMQGNPDGTFHPDGNLTRAEALVMATNVHQIYETGIATVMRGEDTWYEPFVTYCEQTSILENDVWVEYDIPATRAEMAGIFAHTLPESELSPKKEAGMAPDVTDNTPYASEIRRLYAAGVLSGSDCYGTFLPNHAISRAEAAVILSRLVLPSTRRAPILLQDLHLSDYETVCIPQSLQDQSDPSSSLTVWSGPDASLFYQREQNAIWEGASILLFTSEEAEALIIKEIPVIDSMETQLVQFGTVPAYRSDFSFTAQGNTSYCVSYLYLNDGICSFVWMISHQPETVQTMANRYRVHGEGAA